MTGRTSKSTPVLAGTHGQNGGGQVEVGTRVPWIPCCYRRVYEPSGTFFLYAVLMVLDQRLTYQYSAASRLVRWGLTHSTCTPKNSYKTLKSSKMGSRMAR
jgi:hypothetical protein